MIIIIILVVVVVVDVVSLEHVKPSAVSHVYSVAIFLLLLGFFFVSLSLPKCAKTMSRHMIAQESECSFRIR